MIDINNGIIKAVRALAVKKNRDDEGLWVAEGTKCVRDTWGRFTCRWIIATRAWHDQFGTAEHYDRLVLAGKSQMARMSQFTTPSDVIAVYEKPAIGIERSRVESSLNIVLDNIQDPGNLGTIVRLADWYGIRDIFASPTTVDVFNHKVVQATMGAIARVQVHYVDLEELFDDFPTLPVCGTFLDGDNIYSATLPERGFVVFGNEGQGIGAKVGARATQRLLIPKAHDAGSESLNVGLAAAITISEFKRQLFI
ncbi:MAG: RNA methyltransferase [Muribaculaceae bacterium]|nr:RNA methyltransferase [Muribaculaceae bacterium]HAP50077.1 RNA methyltransferase [Porphyromonadaceae bacterium]